MLTHRRIASLAAIVAGTALPAWAGVVSLPYATDFDSGYADFQASRSSFWSNPDVGSGDKVLRLSYTGGNQSSNANRVAIAAVETAETGGYTADTFVQEATFKFTGASLGNSPGNSNIAFGIDALGTGASAVDSGGIQDIAGGYLMNFVVAGAGTQSGNVGKFQLSGTDLVSTFTTGALAISVNSTYTTRLEGTLNNDGSVTLTGTAWNVADPSTTIALTVTTGTSADTGRFFGLRSAVSGSSDNTSSMSGDYLNYSLAVPEPASLALLGLGALMCCRRR